MNTLDEGEEPTPICREYDFSGDDCCIRAPNLSGDPPFGHYKVLLTGKAYYCRPPIEEFESAFSADIQGLTDAVNEEEDEPGGTVNNTSNAPLAKNPNQQYPDTIPMYNLDDPLWQSLFLRSIHVKISETPDNNDPATRFFGNNYEPFFPFKTWKAYEVLERNRFGQVSVEENERGLVTKYGYQIFQPIRYSPQGGIAGNYHCYNYTVNNQENIGVPKSMTVGAGLADSLHYTYTYHPNYAVKNITDPNGLAMDYHYDQFGRLHEVKRAGERISTHEYHQWQNDSLLSFQDRTAENWVKSQVYHTQDQSISTVAYVDPLGRKKATLSAATNENDATPPDGIIVENLQYDNWDRVIQSQKPSAGGTVENLPAQIMGYSTSVEYENDQRGRPLKSYNYDGTFVQTNYQMINGTQLVGELELNAAEESELLLNQAADFVIQKVETTDEDGKKLMEYSNIFGQKMATKQRIGGAEGYAITLFFYDGHGNVKKVINPEKQVSTYTYNLMNWLESKTSVDGGTYSYQHNASGQVRIAFEPTATRIFEYDIFGRMIDQKRVDKNTQFQWDFDSIILPDNAPIGDNLLAFIPEKKWYYHGHLSDNSNTFHPKVLEFTPHISNYKGRLTQSISYSHHGQPNHYNFYTYLIEGYLDSEIKQFNPKGIEQNDFGNTFGVSYKAYNLQGSVLMTGSNTETKGMGMNFYYDEWNRLSEVEATLMPHYFKAKMASYTYDDASGLLLQTDYYNSSLEYELQNTPETACRDVLIDEIFHQYDIRNRLTSMSSATFDYHLYYDENLPIGVSGSFNRNGNINATSAHYKLDNPKITFGGGNVAMTENYMDHPTLSYGYIYDGLNRLTHAFTPSNPDLEGSADYTYDKIGNLTSLNRAGTVNPEAPPIPDNYTYTYDTGNNRLLFMASASSMGKSFTYDGAGNLETSYGHSTKANVSSVNMNIENGRANLPYQIDIDESVVTNYPDGYTQLSQVNYDYDANDQRVYKKVALDQGETTEEYYIFDATGRVLAVHNLQTEDTDWYVHGRERIARFQTRESDAGIPAEAGENDSSWNFPESFHFPNDYTPHIFPLYYIYDHLGNTRVTYRNLFQCGNQDVDGEGGEPTHYLLKHLHDYFPYGKTLREWYASNEDTERFQTTHHQRDTETTLDYRGARFYDADVGRFLSLDPLAADFPNENPFLYVGGNPIVYIDIEGKFKWPAGKEEEYSKKYPTLTAYLQGDYVDYISGQRGVITEMLYSDMLVNSLIRNSWNKPLDIGKLMDAVFYGQGPTLDVFDDSDFEDYASRFQHGRLNLSMKMLDDLENATTDLDKQAVLTVIVSTIFHEYLESLGAGDRTLIENGLILGALEMEEDVWGWNLGSKEEGKRAISISKGEDAGVWWIDGKEVLINDNSTIPTLPDNSRIITHIHYRY